MKRYKLITDWLPDGPTETLREHPDGEFVRYSDVEKIKEELLEAIQSEANNQFDSSSHIRGRNRKSRGQHVRRKAR